MQVPANLLFLGGALFTVLAIVLYAWDPNLHSIREHIIPKQRLVVNDEQESGSQQDNDKISLLAKA